MQWHVHDDLCLTDDPVAAQLEGPTRPDGTGRPPLIKLHEWAMIHVWIVPHVCGPFAALEGVGAGSIKEGEQRGATTPTARNPTRVMVLFVILLVALPSRRHAGPLQPNDATTRLMAAPKRHRWRDRSAQIRTGPWRQFGAPAPMGRAPQLSIFACAQDAETRAPPSSICCPHRVPITGDPDGASFHL